jgi:hypothetical protein
MKTAILAGLLIVVSLPNASAQTANGCFATKGSTAAGEISFLCTQTYQLIGPCDGTDAVQEVKIIGTPPQKDWRIKAWEPVPIIIRGIEVAQGSGGEVEWAMAGHNSWPDIMLMLGRGMTHNRVMFPEKTGFPMPGTPTATESDYLDFHIVCKGGPFSFWFKIEYIASP